MLKKIISLGLFVFMSACTRMDTPAPSIKPPSHKPLTLGLLLPLSGPHKALGEDLQKAAVMAYYNDLKQYNITLLFEDTQGTPKGAKRAYENIHQKVNAIIGPVFSHEARILRDTFKKPLPVFSLTNDKNSVGGSVYAMGLNPLDSMTQMFVFAKQQGVQTVMALLPKSEYGQHLHKALPTLAKSLGLKVHIKMYASHNPYDYGDISFKGVDALFLPEGVNGAKILESLFHRGTDISHVRLMGTSLWDTMTTKPHNGWFTTLDLEKTHEFLMKYHDVYGIRPAALTLILYDVLLLLSQYEEKQLKNPAGFMGLQGPFRLTPHNTTERALAVYGVKEGQPIKIQEAAQGFGQGSSYSVN